MNDPRRCLTCGYRLDGLPSPRCPECGRAFDPNDKTTFGSALRDSKRAIYTGCIALILMWSGPALVIWETWVKGSSVFGFLACIMMLPGLIYCGIAFDASGRVLSDAPRQRKPALQIIRWLTFVSILGFALIPALVLFAVLTSAFRLK